MDNQQIRKGRGKHDWGYFPTALQRSSHKKEKKKRREETTGVMESKKKMVGKRKRREGGDSKPNKGWFAERLNVLVDRNLRWGRRRKHSVLGKLRSRIDRKRREIRKEIPSRWS